MKRCVSPILSLVLWCAAAWALAAEEPKASPVSDVARPAAEQGRISLEAKDAKVSDVIESLAKQSKERILTESSVKGKVTLIVNDMTLESVLTAICKPSGFQWRKVYLKPDSKLPDDPDRLAATVRLMTGLQIPDLVLAGSSTGKVSIHSEDTKAVTAAQDKIVSELAMKRIYLITNDAAVAAKALKDEQDDSGLPKKVNDYVDSQKKQMDTFMEMTPEEKEQALAESLSLMDQVGPEYMASMMQAVVQVDPELLKQITARQMQMMFSMDEATRRRLLRLNMESVNWLTPEQREMLMKDAKAVQEQMQKEKPSE